MKKLLLIATGVSLFLSFIPVGSTEGKINTEPTCEDLIAKLIDKPKELQFLECQKNQTAQSDLLVALYQVPGGYAAKVEGYLQQKFNMSKLHFLCCGWEPAVFSQRGILPGHGFFRDERGYYYEVTMFSEETTIAQRREWKNIPFFYVKTIVLLQDP